VTQDLTAGAFIADVRSHHSDAERAKTGTRVSPGTDVIGIRMGTLFDIAKRYTGMPLAGIDRLLDSPIYEARLGALCIMDFQARRPGITDAERKALFDLYLRRHDRIDTWDMVDRSAPRVIGWYLLDKDRGVLFDLARSATIWERRTAITASFWFIRNGDIDDALRLAEILLHDDEHFIHTSVGVALREVGQVDRDRLVAFLDPRAREMPRVTLRMATEKLPPDVRDRLRS